MIELVHLPKEEMKNLLNYLTKKELLEVLEYCEEFFDFKRKHKKHAINLESKTKRATATKLRVIAFCVDLFSDITFREQLHAKLMKTELSSYLYNELVWERVSVASEYITKKFHYSFKKYHFDSYYETKVEKLSDNLSLIYRHIVHSYDEETDELMIPQNIREVLKLVVAVPKDFSINELQVLPQTHYSYNNEVGVLSFIESIHSLLGANLVMFNTTEVKPLVKTLNILQSTSGVSEFYETKKRNTLATDMLTRTFYAYYKKEPKVFDMPSHQLLKELVKRLLEGSLDFMISRILLMHLKKVRYDEYYQSEQELFAVVEWLVKNMPEQGFVSLENIVNFFAYRNIEIDIDRRRRRDEYYLDGKLTSEDGNVMESRFFVYNDYKMLMFEPLVKGVLFYLGALGIVELRYNDPLSPYALSQKKEPYISVWDGLEAIALTDLGRYVFGMSKTYILKEDIKKAKKAVHLDTFKPIVRTDKADVVMQAKLEAFCDKISEDRYILSCTKIFKDVVSKKGLEKKIEQFYNQIESNPPEVFKNYFDELLDNAGLLQRESKQMVIKLENNQKILQLFMRNKKLKELTIKAEGYRVIVLKENLSKVTKIVKENGFFVEF